MINFFPISQYWTGYRCLIPLANASRNLQIFNLALLVEIKPHLMHLILLYKFSKKYLHYAQILFAYPKKLVKFQVKHIISFIKFFFLQEKKSFYDGT